MCSYDFFSPWIVRFSKTVIASDSSLTSIFCIQREAFDLALNLYWEHSQGTGRDRPSGLHCPHDTRTLTESFWAAAQPPPDPALLHAAERKQPALGKRSRSKRACWNTRSSDKASYVVPQATADKQRRTWWFGAFFPFWPHAQGQKPGLIHPTDVSVYPPQCWLAQLFLFIWIFLCLNCHFTIHTDKGLKMTSSRLCTVSVNWRVHHTPLRGLPVLLLCLCPSSTWAAPCVKVARSSKQK